MVISSFSPCENGAKAADASPDADVEPVSEVSTAGVRRLRDPASRGRNCAVASNVSAVREE
jgi:hypothetical protein